MNTATRLLFCTQWAILRVLESIENDLRKIKVEWLNGFVVELWVQKVSMLRLGNCGITILPFRFWEEIGIKYRRDWHRLYLGLGIFSFFITFKPTHRKLSYETLSKNPRRGRVKC